MLLQVLVPIIVCPFLEGSILCTFPMSIKLSQARKWLIRRDEVFHHPGVIYYYKSSLSKVQSLAVKPDPQTPDFSIPVAKLNHCAREAQSSVSLAGCSFRVQIRYQSPAASLLLDSPLLNSSKLWMIYLRWRPMVPFYGTTMHSQMDLLDLEATLVAYFLPFFRDRYPAITLRSP